MAFLSILSENPKFSWVIVKNPESGIQSRSIRQGTGYGWFSQDNLYNLYFRDGVDCDSFSNTDFEYLSQNKFASPLAISSLLSEFLRDVWKGKSKDDTDEYFNQIYIDHINTKGVKLLEHLSKHLSCDLESKEMYKGSYCLIFKGTMSLEELVGNVMISMLFLAGQDGSYLAKTNEAFIEKYTGIMNKLGMDYYLRYMFARNYLRSKEQFNKHRGSLETDTIKLSHGDTGMQRLRFVEKQLDLEHEILDVGCGEGLYALNLPKRMAHTYHAVDIDEELVGIVGRKTKSRGFDVKTYSDINQYQNDAPVDVLLVEVIEHMEQEQATDLIDYILANVNINKMVITTPNKDFNHNYLIDGFRHDDHKWEMSKDEFLEWWDRWYGYLSGEYDVEFIDIGDCVDGVYTTQGVVLTNKQQQKRAIVTVGCSGSGKSTYASSLVKKGWVEVNRDNFRFRNGERDWSKYSFKRHVEDKITEKCDKLMKQAAEEGKDIIVSDTNINLKTYQKICKTLQDLGYHIQTKVFEEEFGELVKRNENRTGGIPYEALLNQYIRFQKDWKGVKEYKGTPGKPKTVIFDIDGTLADKGDRSPYDMINVDKDTPIEHVAAMANGYAAYGYAIVFLSGRHDTAFEKTVEWLGKHIGEWTTGHALIMREEGDNRKDYTVKMELFDNIIRDNYNVVAVVDDRKQVIEQCWSVLGVPVVNVGKITERF